MTTTYGTRMKVTTRTTAGVLHLQYSYVMSDMSDMRFSFSTLNEVGEPFKREAVRCADHLAQQLGLVIRAKNIDAKPWVVDALVTPQEAEAMDEADRKELEDYRNNLYRR